MSRLLAVLWLTAACGSSSSDAPAIDAGIRSGCQACSSPDECGGLECVDELCMKPCDDGADCGAPGEAPLECTDVNGAFYCVGTPSDC